MPGAHKPNNSPEARANARERKCGLRHWMPVFAGMTTAIHLFNGVDLQGPDQRG
jgi:hypothetical protein